MNRRGIPNSCSRTVDRELLTLTKDNLTLRNGSQIVGDSPLLVDTLKIGESVCSHDMLAVGSTYKATLYDHGMYLAGIGAMDFEQLGSSTPFRCTAT